MGGKGEQDKGLPQSGKRGVAGHAASYGVVRGTLPLNTGFFLAALVRMTAERGRLPERFCPVHADYIIIVARMCLNTEALGENNILTSCNYPVFFS